MLLRLSAVLVALAAATPVLTSPAQLHTVQKYAGSARPNHYVVKLRDGADTNSLVSQLATSAVHAEWSNVITGFSAKLTGNDLNVVRAHSAVESIVQDGQVRVARQTLTQTDATWNLARIGQSSTLNASTSLDNFTWRYRYEDTAGAGVDIYIIDTGILITHVQFGGRAKWGATFGNYSNADGYGHGTHCAGTAAGSQFGVAKSANLIAVKVLGDDGTGYWSDVISGINYAAGEAAKSRRPSVISMSLGGVLYQPVNDVIATLTAQGVHVVVAAGNDGNLASLYSPSSAPSAITVGATDITDTRAHFSNYGPSVDIFAPGVGVWSSYIGNNNATMQFSGTSQACPHVAGLLAYEIAKNGNSSPSILADLVRRTAVAGAVRDPRGSENYLAWNGE